MAIYGETKRKILWRTETTTRQINPREEFIIHVEDDDHDAYLKCAQILRIEDSNRASEIHCKGWFGDGEFNIVSPILWRRELDKSQIHRTVPLPFGAHMNIYWREE